MLRYLRASMQKHVADNWRKTVVLECIYAWYQNDYTILLYHIMMTVLLEYMDHLLQFAINT